MPTEDHRRVLREMLPPVPEQFGGGSGEQIADGLQWAAMGIELPPRPAASLVVQSKDAQSAETLKRLVQACCRAAGRIEDVQEAFPKFDELITLVDPVVRDDRLEITLDRQGIDTVLDALSSPMVRTRETTRRTQCVNNLKQLGVAMWTYHEANERFPAAASYDKDGNKLLSWRVQQMAYLGEGGVNVLFCDGHVQFMKKEVLQATWDAFWLTAVEGRAVEVVAEELAKNP